MALPTSRLCTAGVGSTCSQLSDPDFTSASRMNARNHPIRDNHLAPPLWQLRINSSLSTHFLLGLKNKFTEEQKALLGGAGFSFILSYPANFKTDRQFAVWLLANLSFCHDRLVFHGRGCFDVRRSDVGDILGIPGGSKAVKPPLAVGSGSTSRVRKSEVRFGAIRLTASVKKAESVILDLVGNVYMSPEEKSAFVAAIVIQSVGNFLAPPDRNSGEVEECVLEAIRGEDPIDSYGWQGYILERLSQAAAQVRRELARGCPDGKINLAGCTSFLLYFFYRRCVGHEFPGRVVGTPLISYFTGEVLKLLERGDQGRRGNCRSWVVLSSRVNLDTWTFLSIVKQEAINAEQELARRAAHVVAAEEQRVSQSYAPLTWSCSIKKMGESSVKGVEMSIIVRKHWGDMLQKIMGDVICKQAKITGDAPRPILGNVKLMQLLFSTLEAQLTQFKMNWSGKEPVSIGHSRLWSQACQAPTYEKSTAITDGTPKSLGNKEACAILNKSQSVETVIHPIVQKTRSVPTGQDDPTSSGCTNTGHKRNGNEGSSPLLPQGVQAPLILNIVNATSRTSTDGTAERHVRTTKELCGGSVKYEFCESESPGHKRPCGVLNNSRFAGSVMHPVLQNTVNVALGHGELTPPAWTHNHEDLPVYDKSAPHQGCTSLDDGLSLLAEAAFSATPSRVKRKRSMIELLATDDVNPFGVFSGYGGSNKLASENKSTSWIKPFEQMNEKLFSDGSLDLCLMYTLQSKDVNRAKRNKVWVRFDAPVNVEIKGYEIINHFVDGDAYTLKMMDAVMALFKELDDKLHHDDIGPRWRFFVDPSFTVGCLSNENMYEAGESYALFEQPYLSFEPSECEMGIAPVLVDGSWICFALHLIEHKITAFQPYCHDCPRYIPEQQLREISDRILSNMLPMFRDASAYSYPPLSHWTFELFKWGGYRSARCSDEEAVLVSMFALFFDGKKVVRELCKGISYSGNGCPPRKRLEVPFKWSLCSLLLRREENPMRLDDLF